MSQMTLAQIRTNVRSEILEPNPGFWSDADLNRFINTGKTKIAEVLNMLAAPYAFNTVAAQDGPYNLPANCFQIRRLEVNGYPIDPATVDIRNQTYNLVNGSAVTPQGQPRRYYMLGLNFYLYPAPDQVYSGLLWYPQWVPDLVSDGDIPSLIPAEFHDMLVEYAVGEALNRANDPNAQTYQARFADFLRMVRDLRSAPFAGSETIEEWP